MDFKRQDLDASWNTDVRKDIISSLPDCMLHYILSFLSTKEAVATGILATRWKDLWTAVPIVDFDDSLLFSSCFNAWYPVETTRFLNFVERVLLLRDASNIERFRLSCRVCFTPSRVHAWISAAVRHKVKELDLCLFVDDPFLLPHCVLNCGSLTVLKLEMNCMLQLPGSMSLPSLRILHLALVIFADDKSTQRLLSCCPMLEELAILDCDWMNLRYVCISCPSLKSLIIDDLPVFDSSSDSQGCEIKIDAGNLVFLKYSGYLSNEMHLYDVSCLVKASLHIPVIYQTGKELLFYRLLNLFHRLKNVCSLGISSCTLESLFVVGKMPNHLPEFCRLTNLELSSVLGFQTVGSLIKFLVNLPKLESLNFIKGLDPLICLAKDDWTPKSASKCFLSSLKTVDIQNFHGNYAEVCLLQILLEHAFSLERINLSCYRSPSRDSERLKDMRNRLQSLPRASGGCAIVFL